MGHKGQAQPQTQTPDESPASAVAAMASAAETGGDQSARGPVVGRKRWVRLILLVAVFGGLFACRGWWWPQIFRSLADDRIRHGHVEDGLAWLEYVDWLVPDDAATTLLRARAYRKLGEMQRVAELLTEARREGATPAQVSRERILAYAQSGQMRQAEQHLGRLLSDPEEDVDDVCEAYVLGYTRNQRFGDAFNILEAWIQDSPDLATPYFLRGRLRAFRSNHVEAEADFRDAIELDPDRDEFRLELALTLIQTNRHNDAIPLLEDCLDTTRLRREAVIQLAICRSATGDDARALSLLAEARREFPEEPRILLELGRLQSKVEDHDAAIATLTEAVDIDPQNDEIHYLLAQALSLCGRHDEAAPHFAFFEQAAVINDEIDRLLGVISRNPADIEALVSLGQLYLEHGHVEEAVVRLMSALDLDPEHQQARRLLFEYYSSKAQSDPAYQALAEEHRRYLE